MQQSTSQSYFTKDHVLMLDDACLAFSISKNMSFTFKNKNAVCGYHNNSHKT